jgi:Mg2+/Co2+ transporter CorC
VSTLKIRESDMPSEEQLDRFFKPKSILKQLGISQKTKDVVDLVMDTEHSQYPLRRSLAEKSML